MLHVACRDRIRIGCSSTPETTSAKRAVPTVGGPTPPGALLRSFADDALPFVPPPTPGRILLHQIRGTFEEFIAERLYSRGPVVAIAAPGTTLPPIGAARENIINGDWQGRVVELLREASHVVAILGPTEGLRWELEALQRHGLLERATFVIPPVRGDGRLSRARLLAELVAPDALLELPAQVLADALAARFCNGRFVLLRARDAAWWTYEHALEWLLAFDAPAKALESSTLRTPRDAPTGPPSAT
jgi:hypothetical protein